MSLNSKDYINNLLERFDILDVISKFSGDETVSIGTDTYELSEKTCPFCGHQDAFRIKHQGPESFFNCFSCETGGDFINFVAKLKKLKNMDAARLIEEEFSGSEIATPKVASPPAVESTGIFAPTDQQLQIKNAACEYYHAKLLEEPTALSYQLSTRRRNQTNLEQWKIGFSDGRLVNHLKKKGFTEESIREVGLANEKGYDVIPKGSFVYPHMDKDGRVGHFTQKDPKKEKRWQPLKATTFFGLLFYGENTLRRLDESKQVALVEGENDLLSMLDAGWKYPVLATNGAISRAQMEWLGKQGFNLKTFFDTDDAGDKYRVRFATSEGITATQYIVPGKDIDEYLKQGGSLSDLMQPSNEWPRGTEEESQLDLSKMSSSVATDLTNAHILSKRIQKRARFISETKEWAWYDASGRWIKNGHPVVKTIAIESVGSVWRLLASKSKDDKEAGRIISHAKYSEGAPGLRNMMTIAENNSSLIVSAADFDRDWFLLGVQNGVIDLRNMAFRKSRPSDMITKCMNAEYKPEAECPTWIQFLTKAFSYEEGENGKAMIELIQLAAGMALVGRPERKRFFHIHGPHGSGKTVFLNTLTCIFGSYAGSVSPNSLMQPRFNDPDVKMPEIAKLVGVRLIGVAEAGDEFCFNDELLKRMTGGDPLVVRELHKAPITFRCMGTIVMNGNSLPSSSTNGSKAMMDRMTPVNFGRTIPQRERDAELPEKLAEEYPGILNWIIEGAQKYLAQGLTLPDHVQKTCNDYVKSMDDIGLYIDEHYVIDPNGSILTTEFYTGYSEWSKALGGMPKSMKRVSPYMEQKGFHKRRNENRHYFTGLRRIASTFMG